MNKPNNPDLSPKTWHNPGLSPEAWEELHRFIARVLLKRSTQAKLRALSETSETRPEGE